MGIEKQFNKTDSSKVCFPEISQSATELSIR